MKAIASIAIAGIIAAASLTTTATTADAGGKYKYKHSGHHYPKYHVHKHYHSKGWNPGAAFATGTILGLAFGGLAAPTYYYTPPPVVYYPPPPPAYPTYYAYSAGPNHAQHASWCHSRYRSYNVQYNTWVGFDGIVRQCVSPFPY